MCGHTGSVIASAASSTSSSTVRARRRPHSAVMRSGSGSRGSAKTTNKRTAAAGLHLQHQQGSGAAPVVGGTSILFGSGVNINLPDRKPIVGLQVVAPATIQSYEDYF